MYERNFILNFFIKKIFYFFVINIIIFFFKIKKFIYLDKADIIQINKIKIYILIFLIIIISSHFIYFIMKKYLIIFTLLLTVSLCSEYLKLLE